ncbi:hypothetical protein JT05_06750 [Desulfosporosinus sp. Tol-M]|nr:hypothetical protein JT05_06750 [Desulfosporosinus sp. Tol-M]
MTISAYRKKYQGFLRQTDYRIVSPGFINTEGQRTTSELIKNLVLNDCAIRHLTEPEEVADFIVYLASDKARCITGQIYRIDCGQYI